jgi:hypothetical protein
MRIRIVLTLTLLALLLGGRSARAGYTFVFADGSGTATNNFTIDQAHGQTSVDIRVYLAQTGGTTGLSATGLNAAGVQLGSFNASVATVADTSAIKANDANPGTTGVGGHFDSVNTIKGFNSGSPYLTEQYTASSSALLAATSGADANRILVGTFTFTPGSPAGGTTSTVTANPFPGSAVDVLADGTDITNLIANATATITVTAVPEPSTLLMCGLFATGIGTAAWRRYRRCTV